MVEKTIIIILLCIVTYLLIQKSKDRTIRKIESDYLKSTRLNKIKELEIYQLEITDNILRLNNEFKKTMKQYEDAENYKKG